MENRHKIEVGVAIAVVLGLFVLLFVLLRAPSTEEQKPSGTVPVADQKPEVPEVESVDIPSQPLVSAQTTARNFVERFGSFSSDTNYLNIDDVLPLATKALQRRLEDLAAEARENASDSYYGVSTRAIIFTVEKEADAAVTMLVTTQRQESIDSPANTSVRNQQIRVDIVNDGNGWLIDDFAWLE